MRSLKYLPFVLFSFVFLAACQPKQDPQQDKQYSELQPAKQPLHLNAVTYVFSLTCSACRDMQSQIPTLEKLTKQHFGSLPLTADNPSQVAAVFYYAAAMQSQHEPSAELIQNLYQELLQSKGRTLTEQQNAIEQVFNHENLVSPYQFDSMQQKVLSRELDHAIAINQSLALGSAPSFIVRGKYLVHVNQHESIDQLADTINYLLSKH